MKIVKISFLLGVLFIPGAFASDSLFPCDVKLFNGYSEDKKTHFTICENRDNVTAILIDLETNDVIDDIKVSKSNMTTLTEGPIKMFTLLRGNDKNEGGYGYIETNLASRLLLVSSPDGAQVAIKMAKPEINIF